MIIIIIMTILMACTKFQQEVGAKGVDERLKRGGLAVRLI